MTQLILAIEIQMKISEQVLRKILSMESIIFHLFVCLFDLLSSSRIFSPSKLFVIFRTIGNSC